MLDAKESTGTADFGLYFRITADIPFVGFTASPYFIGPVPWLPTKEKSPIFLGSNVAASLAPAAVSLTASQASGNANQSIPESPQPSYKTASAKTSSTQTSPLATGKFTSPVSLNQARESSPFGNRFHPIDHREKFHAGVDLAVPLGTAVKAADGGIVSFAGVKGGYGNFVEIDHGNGIKTRYGHLSQLKVRAGQVVQQGQGIALSGSTGHSTGPHLHFEIRKNNQPVDPANYIGGIQ
jgi:murein DD-endopeptidase MepM/ murein hydrolase activator NlpD